MNIFHKVTLESLKKNRVRTAVTIIGIVLSCSLMTAVTTSVSSLSHYLTESVIYKDGKWHSSYLNADENDLHTLESADEVTEAAYSQRIGYAEIGSSNENKPYLCILGMSEGFAEMVSVHLISGELPTTEGELLIPDHLSKNGGVTYHIGDTLTLDIGERVYEGEILGQDTPNYIYTSAEETQLTDEFIDVRETRTYTVCGIYQRPDFEPYQAPGYSCLTVEESGDYPLDIYYTVQHPGRIYDFMTEAGLQGETHTDLLMLMGVSRFLGYYQVVYGMAAILIVLILFGSVALIYNAFAISVSERTKQFGLLSSVGATRKQLRRMVRFESLCVSAVGIPLGVLVGIAGITVTFLAIGGKFVSIMENPVPMRIHVSALSLVISVLVSLLTVLISAWIPSRRATKASAVEAIRQNTDIKSDKPIKTPKWVYKVFGLPGMLGQKYFKCSRKKYRATILSLFMSVVLFISASAFTDYLTESVTGMFEPTEWDLRYWDEAEDTASMDGLQKRILACEHVTGAAGTLCVSSPGNVETALMDAKRAAAYADSDPMYQEPGRTPLYLVVDFVTENEYRAFLRDNNLSEEIYMNAENPLGVAINEVRYFDEEAGRSVQARFMAAEAFEVHLARFRNLEGYEMEGFEDMETVIYRKTDDPDASPRLMNVEDVRVWSKIQVGAIVDKAPWFVDDTYSMVVLYPESALRSVMPYLDDTKRGTHEFFIKTDDHAAAYESVNTMLAEEGIDGYLYDKTEEDENERNLVTIVKVFSYGFIILISLIAAANVFNSISTNVALRRREFAMLKTVGMTDRGLMGMMNYECLLYGTRALLYGLPVSAIVTALIWRVVHNGFDTGFRLPWDAVGFAVLSVFAVVFATMLYAMGKIRQDNPIDALKNENL